MNRLLVAILLFTQAAFAEQLTYCLAGAWNMAQFEDDFYQNVEVVGLRIGQERGNLELFADVINVGFGITIKSEPDSAYSYDGSLLFVDERNTVGMDLTWAPEVGISYSILRQAGTNSKTTEGVDVLSLQAGYSLQGYLSSKKYISYPYLGMRVLLYSWGVDWSNWRDIKIYENQFYMGVRLDPINWNQFSITWSLPLHFPATTYTRL
jgi:hypothetical protein